MKNSKFLKYMMIASCYLQTSLSWAMEEVEFTNLAEKQVKPPLRIGELINIDENQQTAQAAFKPKKSNERYPLSFTTIFHTEEVMAWIREENAEELRCPNNEAKLKSFFACHHVASLIRTNPECLTRDPRNPVFQIVYEKDDNHAFTLQTHVKYKADNSTLSSIKFVWDENQKKNLIDDIKSIPIENIEISYNQFWDLCYKSIKPHSPPELFIQFMEDNIEHSARQRKELPPLIQGDTCLTEQEILFLKSFYQKGFFFNNYNDPNKQTVKAMANILLPKYNQMQWRRLPLADVVKKTITIKSLSQEEDAGDMMLLNGVNIEVSPGFEHLWKLRHHWCPTRYLSAILGQVLSEWTEEEQKYNINTPPTYDIIDYWLTSYMTNNNLSSIVDFLLMAQLTSVMDKEKVLENTKPTFEISVIEKFNDLCPPFRLGDQTTPATHMEDIRPQPTTLNIAQKIIRNMRNAIIFQNREKKHSYSRTVYRPTALSAVEIFLSAYEGTSYIPSFISAFINEEDTPWSPCEEDEPGHNVMQVFDLSQFNAHSTLIQPHQSPDSEQKVLLAPYNVYKLQRIKYNDEKQMVRLYYKVKNPDLYTPKPHDPTAHDFVENYIKWHSHEPAQHKRATYAQLKYHINRFREQSLKIPFFSLKIDTTVSSLG